jgi:sulfofructose kinase
MTVLVIGNAIYDTVFSLSTLHHGEKTFASAVREYAGGQGANAAVAIAGLGQAVSFIGRFGDDHCGTQLRDALKSAGIESKRSLVVAGAQSTRGWIFVESVNAHRTIVMHRDEALYSADLAVTEECCEDADILYSDGHEFDATMIAAQLFRSRNKPVVLDIEIVDRRYEALLPFVTHLIAPELVVCDLGGSDDVVSAMKALRAKNDFNVVATRGPRGSVGLFRGLENPVDVPAISLTALDTTGAGDAFHGGFVAALAQGLTEIECSEFATRVAALKCVNHGPSLNGNLLAGLRSELTNLPQSKAAQR